MAAKFVDIHPFTSIVGVEKCLPIKMNYIII